MTAVQRVGIVAWTIIGCILVAAATVSALAAVSELVLPLIFAVMLGAAIQPLARRLQRWMKPGAAAATVVFGSLAGIGLVAVLVVRNIAHETGSLAHQIDLALDELSGTTSSVGLDAATLDSIRAAIRQAAAFIGRGIVTLLIGGVGAVTGFIAGIVLAILIGYYVLKDGPLIKSWLVRQFPAAAQSEVRDFLSTGVRSIRSYWAGRTVLSAAVSVVISVVSLLLGLPLVGTIAVVNFLGGYIPYLGAFLGGGLAVLLAVAEGGVSQGVLMLVIVLACNLLLENVLEPRVMGERLAIHPLVVLLATTAGGILGGMVGLILAVPVAALVIDLVRRIRASGIGGRIPLKVPRLPGTASAQPD
ncbi:MAG: AI-2E family transporter [Ilumatobacteraceae bacterium]